MNLITCLRCDGAGLAYYTVERERDGLLCDRLMTCETCGGEGKVPAAPHRAGPVPAALERLNAAAAARYASRRTHGGKPPADIEAEYQAARDAYMNPDRRGDSRTPQPHTYNR